MRVRLVCERNVEGILSASARQCHSCQTVAACRVTGWRLFCQSVGISICSLAHSICTNPVPERPEQGPRPEHFLVVTDRTVRANERSTGEPLFPIATDLSGRVRVGPSVNALTASGHFGYPLTRLSVLPERPFCTKNAPRGHSIFRRREGRRPQTPSTVPRARPAGTAPRPGRSILVPLRPGFPARFRSVRRRGRVWPRAQGDGGQVVSCRSNTRQRYRIRPAARHC